MINCSFLWSFVDQLLIRRHKVPGDDNIPKKLLTVESHLLRIYQSHVAVIKVQDQFENVLSGWYTLLEINIGDVGMILGRSWLNQVDPDIHWAKDTISFCQQGFHNWNRFQEDFWVNTSKSKVLVPDPTVDAISFNHPGFKWNQPQ